MTRTVWTRLPGAQGRPARPTYDARTHPGGPGAPAGPRVVDQPGNTRRYPIDHARCSRRRYQGCAPARSSSVGSRRSVQEGLRGLPARCRSRHDLHGSGGRGRRPGGDARTGDPGNAGAVGRLRPRGRRARRREAAEQLGAADPARVVREFKRRIGDPVPLVVGGSPYSAQAFTARLLARVVGSPPSARAARRTRVRHPPGQLGAVQARPAGPGRSSWPDWRGATSTRTEPEAAAIAYAARDRVAEGDRIAVYDLGGGTFDAAVLVREGAGFRLAGPPEGVEHLGGSTSTRPSSGTCSPPWATTRRLDDTDPTTVTGWPGCGGTASTLRRCCPHTDTADPGHAAGNQPVGAADPRRAGRHAAPRDRRDRGRDATGAGRGRPHRGPVAILMVGGSSRIPLVSQMLSVAFGRPLAMDNHPKHDVALGAALGAPAPPPATDHRRPRPPTGRRSRPPMAVARRGPPTLRPRRRPPAGDPPAAAGRRRTGAPTRSRRSAARPRPPPAPGRTPVAARPARPRPPPAAWRRRCSSAPCSWSSSASSVLGCSPSPWASSSTARRPTPRAPSPRSSRRTASSRPSPCR